MDPRFIKEKFPQLDKDFREIDRTHIRRTNNIQLIPDFLHRRGGKTSYAEWAYVIGIFQTLFYQTLNKKTGNKILDIGCGNGFLAIPAQHFISSGGSYTGIDVMKYVIDFASKHFDSELYKFIFFDVANASYANFQSKSQKPWPVESNSFDMVTALSVWTHFNEKDAIYYFKEVQRVLKKGGRAIITFFHMNEDYEKSLTMRSDNPGRYNTTNQLKWIFDTNAYDSKNWFTPNWTKEPEDAIGVTEEGLQQLIKESDLKLIKNYPGSWKEIPGIYFQDILIFEK